MKRKTQLIIGGVIIAAILGGIMYQGMESTVFFYTPAEILAEPAKFKDKTIRIGALVQPGTTTWDPEAIRLAFNITEDSQLFIPVEYEGVKPDLYREGQGVVVEGRLGGDGIFRASNLLVKHSEEYSVDETKKSDKEKAYKSLITQ